MNEEMGLAAAASQQQQPTPQDMVMKIVELLVQGVTIEELVAKGVPRELIQAAVEIVKQQQQQATQVPPEQAGLAAQMVQGPM